MTVEPARPTPGMSTTERDRPRTRTRSVCPVCGRVGSRLRFEEGDRLFDVAGRFRYVECLSCATVFQNPCVVADDLPLLYPKSYFTHQESPLGPGERGTGLRGARDRIAELVRAAVQRGTGRPGLAGDDTSVLVGTDRPEALARGILALASDLERRSGLGRAAADRATAMDVARWAPKLEQLYADVLLQSESA